MRQRRPDVLCIDDDPTGLETRKVLLEAFGYRVTTALNGPDGLRLLNSRHTDLVLLDYQMPGMTGGEVAARAKQLRPQTPILMLSALPALPLEAPAECIDAFVWKGDPTAQLLATLERLLAGHAEAEQDRKAERAMTALDAAIEKLSSVVDKVRQSVQGGMQPAVVNLRCPKTPSRHSGRSSPGRTSPQFQRS